MVSGCLWCFCQFVDFCYKELVGLCPGPDDGHTKQSMYPGFERDILRTVADYFQELDEPLLTFPFYDVFVSILGESILFWLVGWKHSTKKEKKLF